MRDGAFHRELSPLPSRLEPDALARHPDRFVLVASLSCPWSHATVLARQVAGFSARLALQIAGGPRVEGYAIAPGGPLAEAGGSRHAHQLCSATDPRYTGRATAPVLWDGAEGRILSNSSADILRALAEAAPEAGLRPPALATEIDRLTAWIFEGLSNAVYRAGEAERQDAYEAAVRSVFETLDALEPRLADPRRLLGAELTEPDLRLFATWVRFDTVDATHFRRTLRRLVDYPALWAYARRIYQRAGVAERVDFDEIRRGCCLNDGSHNPHGVVAVQPDIDWTAPVAP